MCIFISQSIFLKLGQRFFSWFKIGKPPTPVRLFYPPKVCVWNSFLIKTSVDSLSTKLKFRLLSQSCRYFDRIFWKVRAICFYLKEENHCFKAPRIKTEKRQTVSGVLSTFTAQQNHLMLGPAPNGLIRISGGGTSAFLNGWSKWVILRHSQG